jgi:hypothetical protein
VLVLEEQDTRSREEGTVGGEGREGKGRDVYILECLAEFLAFCWFVGSCNATATRRRGIDRRRLVCRARVRCRVCLRLRPGFPLARPARKDLVNPGIPDNHTPCLRRGRFDEVVLPHINRLATRTIISTEVTQGKNKERHTHKQCTLVSVALRFALFEFGSPGRPYMIAQLTELEAEICRRRS